MTLIRASLYLGALVAIRCVQLSTGWTVIKERLNNTALCGLAGGRSFSGSGTGLFAGWPCDQSGDSGDFKT